MNLRSGPIEHMVFEQLKLIERRRLHILNSVSMHISKQKIQELLQTLTPKILDKKFEISPDDIIDEIDSKIFLRKLAYELEWNEARMIQLFLASFTKDHDLPSYILQGARIAGQEAARNYNMKCSYEKFDNLTHLHAALSYLNYSGIPSDKYYFYSLRPLSDITIHYNKCAHLTAWENASVDPVFMNQVQEQWIGGILDVLSPNTIHQRVYSIAKGNSYGLDKFFPQEKLVQY